MANFAERVKSFRQRNGLSQAEMGQKLSITGKYLSMVERGATVIEEESTISKLLAFYEEKEKEGKFSPKRGRDALKAARLKKGLSVADTAKSAGYSVGTYQDIEDGHSSMSEKMAERVAKILGVDVSVLMDGSDEPPMTGLHGTVGASPDITLPDGMKARNVPLLSWAQCGQMMAYDDTAYTHEGFTVIDPEDRKTFAVRLSGDSMAPVYGPGDTAIVYPSFPARNGDLVIARLTEEAGGDVMFKIYQGNAEEVTLTSYNPAYAPIKERRERFAWIYPVDQVNKKVRRHS